MQTQRQDHMETTVLKNKTDRTDTKNEQEGKLINLKSSITQNMKYK